MPQKVRNVKLISLAAGCAAAACLALPAAPAAAYTPTAIAVGPDGTSYVAGRGVIQRISKNGKPRGRKITGAFGRVAALSVAPDRHLLVLDGSSNTIVELTEGGRILRTQPVDGCDGKGTRPGGLDVSDSIVVASSTCSDSVVALDRATFTDRRSITLPGAGAVAVNRWAACGYRIVVARPNNHDVVRLSGDLKNAGRVRIGGRVTGVTLDDFGVITAAETTHDRIRMYGCGGSLFRTLGGPGSRGGALREPQGLDVFGQYGGGLAGNLFVADADNRRVQRWNAYGYTYWTASTTGLDVTPTPPELAAASTDANAPVISNAYVADGRLWVRATDTGGSGLRFVQYGPSTGTAGRVTTRWSPSRKYSGSGVGLVARVVDGAGNASGWIKVG